MRDFIQNPINISIIALLGAMIFIYMANARLASPILFLANRWIRCAIISLSIAIIADMFFEGRSFAILMPIGILIYFLVYTLLCWMQVSLINGSGIDILPKYKEIENAWSAEKKHILLKNEILKLGFTKTASLKSDFIDDISSLTTIFDSSDKTLRMNVSFLPYSDMYILASSVTSLTENGEVYMTEAVPVPFGLLYPEKYQVERHPLISNPLSILKFHKKRIEKSGKKFIPIETSPMEFLNKVIDEIKAKNLKEGLINRTSDFDEDGYLSSGGKYLVWKDMITMSYFPFICR